MPLPPLLDWFFPTDRIFGIFFLGFILYAATGIGKGQFQIFPFMAMSSEMLPLLGVNLNAFDRMLVHILRILS